jgi:DNA-binding transcriptional LysR family regulator
LTDVGESFQRHARIALDAVKNAEASVRQVDDAVRGDLRVSVPPMMTESFRAMLCDFAERYPEVRLQVHVTSRVVDLRRDGYDVALRASTELEPGLIARQLAREPLLAVASPAYLAANGTPESRRDLVRHRCLMGFARGELPQTHWSSSEGGRLHVEGAFYTNELPLLRDAALRGLGIACLPLRLVHAELLSGALLPVLLNELRDEVTMALVYAEREFVPPAVRAFVDAVVAWAPEELAQKLPDTCRVAWAAHDRSSQRRSNRKTKKKRVSAKRG